LSFVITFIMSTFHLRLVTPDRPLFEGEVKQVTLPTINGEITVLPHHVPLVTPVGAGELRVILADDSISPWVVSGGVAQVSPDGVVVLAEAGEHVDELAAEAEIEEASRRAQSALDNASRLDEEEMATVSAALERELARLRAVRKYKNRAV
jgi:F-type H+-transporting ATPase subunit epsilon